MQEEGEGEMRGVGRCERDRGGILTLGFSDPLPPSLPPTAKVVVVGSQIRPQDREREGVIFKAAVPPPPQEQGEEFGIWFASDRGIFENLPSGGGCNKENGWLDRTVGGGGGETYCAAVSRRRSERGIRSYEVRSQPRTFKYHILRVRKSAWSMAKYSHPPPPPLNSTRRAAQYSPLFLRRLIMLPPPPSDFFWCLLLSSSHIYYHYYTLARTRALMQKKSSRV